MDWTWYIIFSEKNEYNNYNVGIINAGQGVDLHGCETDNCNGILIFENIKKELKDEFFNLYFNNELFSNNLLDEYSKLKLYDNIYLLLQIMTICNNSKKNLTMAEFISKNKTSIIVNIKELIKNKQIKTIQIHKQIIGSCTYELYKLYCLYVL